MSVVRIRLSKSPCSVFNQFWQLKYLGCLLRRPSARLLLCKLSKWPNLGAASPSLTRSTRMASTGVWALKEKKKKSTIYISTFDSTTRNRRATVQVSYGLFLSILATKSRPKFSHPAPKPQQAPSAAEAGDASTAGAIVPLPSPSVRLTLPCI